MIGMIVIAIILLPVFLGIIAAMFSTNHYPYNVSAAWKHPVEPVFESEEKLDSYSISNEMESSFQQPKVHETSEPTGDMDGAISELMTAVKTNHHDQELREPQRITRSDSAVISEPSSDMDLAIDELLSAVETSKVCRNPNSHLEANAVSPPKIKNELTSINHHFQLDVKSSPAREEWSETIQSDICCKPQYLLNAPVEQEDQSNMNQLLETSSISKNEDVLSDIPEIFMEQDEESDQNEGIGFDEDDVATFISSEPVRKASPLKNKIPAEMPDSVEERTPIVHEGIGVNTNEVTENDTSYSIDMTEGVIDNESVIPFAFDQLPTPLSIREYRAIQRRYGDVVAQLITTTPAIGGTIASDIMIGRLEEIAVGYVLSYNGSFIVLEGEVPKHFLNSAILVYGYFRSQEHFYVYEWCDPESCSQQSMPPFIDSKLAASY